MNATAYSRPIARPIPHVGFRAPMPGDIDAIADRIVPIEVAECAANGRTPREALELGLRQSSLIWTGEIDGVPEAMFGVVGVNVMDGIGLPWMLGTERAKRAGRAFVSIAPAYLRRIEALYPKLENEVARDNLMSIRWLKKLNFTVSDKVEYRGGLPMVRFSKGF